jgi:hypothetical protein
MDSTVCSQPLTFDEQHSPRKVKPPRLTAVAPAWASADRQVVDRDSLDLTLCLRHVDDSTELNFCVAGRRTFFSKQLGLIRGASISCLTLSIPCSFIRSTPRDSSWGGLINTGYQSDTDSKPRPEGEKYHEGKRLIFYAERLGVRASSCLPYSSIS